VSAAFILGMRDALVVYGDRVADRGVSRFTVSDAEPIRAAWHAGVANIMAEQVDRENLIHGWPTGAQKAADGSARGDAVPSILLDNPYATEFLKTQGAELVVQIDETTRFTIRAFLKRGMDEHLPVKETARLLRAVMPLTQQQLGAIDHMVQEQLAAGRSPEQVAALAEKFRARLVASRALTIARTETIRASAAGLQASWAAASDRGLLSDSARQRWIGGGTRACGICNGLAGTEAPLGGEFAGGHTRPPSHPCCRCTLGLVTA
jgi:hypothetical protein